MRKLLLNRKRLLQLALSLCLILVSANTSWGQSITVPNGDFSAGSTLTGTSPWTSISGWTITQNGTINAVTTSGNAAITNNLSGVVSGALTFTGTNSTAGANNNNNQAALSVESSRIDISAYAGTTTAFTFAFQIKVATATGAVAPWNEIIRVFDSSNVDITATALGTATKTQGNLKTTTAGTYVNASIAASLTATGAPAYIVVQVHLGQIIGNTPTVDNFTLTAAGAAASTTLTQPVSTTLSYEIGAGPSASESFQVAGANLGSNNITVTPGTNIEISSTSGSGFGSSAITLTPSSGTVANTTLYARLIAGLALGTGGSNTVRQVNVAATGTTTKTVQFNGSINGINTTTITGSALSYVTDSGLSAEGSFTVTTNGLTSVLVVTPGSDLEVSTTSGTGFQSTAITLPSTTTSQVIYSRLKTGLSAGSYSGASTTVVVSSSGFTSVTKQFTGTIPTTWNGTSWSNTSGPTTSIDAIIDGNFSTSASGVTAGFTAKTLTVNATRSFTINSGHNITVAGAITNNGTITIENNANLVQTAVANTNSGSGTAIVKRNSASIQLFDYTLWSSPVVGQNLRTFSNSTLANRIYTYNSTTNQYNVVDFTNPVNFAPATGYLIRAPNTWAAATPNNFNGVFTGVLNNGPLSKTLNYTDDARSYNLVGNPYPSTIDSETFLTSNSSSIENTLYFWRKTNGASGSAYATYTLGGATTSTPTSAAPNGTIQVGQGFFVKAKSATTLNFTNSMRLTSTSTQFFRTTTETERNRIWLNLTNTSGVFSQTLVGYMTDATQNIDIFDGRYINDAPVALTSLIGSEEYTIQGRALPFSTSDSVPLGFKTNAAGNYTIAIDHVDGLFSRGQTVFLKDNLLNTVTDLSAGSYSFASSAGTFNSRFEIVYQRVLGVNNPEFTSNNVVAFNDHGAIKINSGSTIMEQVRVYDLQGRLLVEKKQINANETRINTSASNQVLLLEITATTGTNVVKKIIQ
jgi:trimeric autotransporter adhesin